MKDAVEEAYVQAFYHTENPEGIDDAWEIALREQGQLCWMTRRLNEDGTPQLWQIGMKE